MIAAPGKVHIANLSLPLKNEIYFFDAPLDTTHLLVKARNASTIKLSFNDETDYITLPPNYGYYEQNIKFNGVLSFISSVDNEVMEMIFWSGTP